MFSHEYQLLREALLEARLRAGVTQRGLAERLGKSHSHVARIENGQRRVDTLEFYRIARSIGVAPVQLFEAVSRKLEEAERAAEVQPGVQPGVQPAA
ncbi:XRE family transcriptional regulator [Phenylobacterium soli]|uniref:XRE family transcriptional regulator n=1 Tax=Phenylobacterium soli TaxID=2170551 RepID=A0A328ABK4_9CAUL|nr:XRE family transcriptional regulator [Phenylobacterium soli]